MPLGCWMLRGVHVTSVWRDAVAQGHLYIPFLGKVIESWARGRV